MKKLIIACIVLSSISSCTFKEQQKDQKGSHLTWLDKFPVDSMIYRITEGNSDSEIYDITLPSGKKYIARTLPNTMSLHKLSHEIFMAKKTSDLKISPFLHFVSADERLLIMDFIEGELFYAPKAKINLISILAHKLKQLHNFQLTEQKNTPKSLITLFQFKSRAQSYKKLRNIFIQMENDLLSHSPLTLCHMDLHPGNIIQSDNNIWIIDWADSQLYSPYYDLARIAVDIPFSNQKETKFIKEYFYKNQKKFDDDLYYIAKNLARIKVIDLLLTSFIDKEDLENTEIVENIFAKALKQTPETQRKINEVLRIVDSKNHYNEVKHLLNASFAL